MASEDVTEKGFLTGKRRVKTVKREERRGARGGVGRSQVSGEISSEQSGRVVVVGWRGFPTGVSTSEVREIRGLANEPMRRPLFNSVFTSHDHLLHACFHRLGKVFTPLGFSPRSLHTTTANHSIFFGDFIDQYKVQSCKVEVKLFPPPKIGNGLPTHTIIHTYRHTYLSNLHKQLKLSQMGWRTSVNRKLLKFSVNLDLDFD